MYWSDKKLWTILVMILSQMNETKHGWNQKWMKSKYDTGFGFSIEFRCKLICLLWCFGWNSNLSFYSMLVIYDLFDVLFYATFYAMFLRLLLKAVLTRCVMCCEEGDRAGLMMIVWASLESFCEVKVWPGTNVGRL